MAKEIITTPSLIIKEFPHKPTLKFSKEILSDITFLHALIGEVEWNGMLFYTIESGTIQDLNSLVLVAHRMYPMAIGSSSFVEFDYGAACVGAYDMIDGAIEMEQGIIHTHHKMGAFFSGTDTEDLATNASKYRMYLSVVVDFKCEWVAKIAIPISKASTSYTIKNGTGGTETISDESEGFAAVVDCKIKYEHNVDFVDRLLELQAAKKIKEQSVKVIERSNYFDYDYQDYYNNKHYPKPYGNVIHTPKPVKNKVTSFGGTNTHKPKKGHTQGVQTEIGFGRNKETDLAVETVVAKAIMMDSTYEGTLGEAIKSNTWQIAHNWEYWFKTIFIRLFNNEFGKLSEADLMLATYKFEALTANFGSEVDVDLVFAIEEVIEDIQESLTTKKDGKI